MVFYSTDHVRVKDAQLVPHEGGAGGGMPQFLVLDDVVRKGVSQLLHVPFLFVPGAVFFDVVEQAAEVRFARVHAVEFREFLRAVRHVQGMDVAALIDLFFEEGLVFLYFTEVLFQFFQRQFAGARRADVRGFRRLDGHFEFGVCGVLPQFLVVAHR